MDFGKLPNVDRVDFTLPTEPPANATLLANLPPREGPPRILIGPTGYNTKDWVGRWYPTAAKERDFLRYYGQQFNTIEHNTTHYRIPDFSTVERWRDEVPADFRYCPKVPQTLSHARDLGLSNPQFEEFCLRMEDFGDRLGCCFLQLPPYFDLRQLPVLWRLLDRWPLATVPLAVEVRHESFFANTPGAEAFFRVLADRKVAAVITDVAGRRDVCHLRLTAERTLIRFVGNSLHPSDYQRVDEWAQRLAFWLNAGLHEVYFFTHEPDNILAPDLAEYAAKAFRAAIPQAVLRGPVPVPPPARQGSLF